MLTDITKKGMFVMWDEAETSSAGEQLVRNNLTNWNSYEVGLIPTSFNFSILVIYAFKNSKIFIFCPFYAGAVQ